MDAESDYYYLQTRYYSPVLRRFLSHDRYDLLSTCAEDGHLNLYTYCNNNPVMYTDPTGEFPIVAILIGAAIGFLTSYLPDVISEMKDGFEWSDLNTFEGNGWKYFGATLGGAIGGISSNFGATILASGIANVVETAFSGNISSPDDVIIQFALGGIIGAAGYGISKGITKIFADKKIFGILGNLSDNAKVNKRLAGAGYDDLKIGKLGLSGVYDRLYKKLGFGIMENLFNYSYNMLTGLAF
ncbi:MAG: RHS repeat-associated core domain-containing protein [Clostridia bacterium]|nr:RHS repeat-associated core domain-containing protein [Clostridia bacterium]